MSILKYDTIDGVALNDEDSELRLLILDEMDWDDEYNHLISLQSKINNYIIFCEEKQYKKIYKNEVKYAVLEIHFMFEPSENALKFLEQVNKQILELGITMECHIMED